MTTPDTLPALPDQAPPAEEPSKPSVLGGFFRQHGQEMRLESNRPLLLDQADKAYFVAAGGIDVFTTAVEDGHATGPRSHFISAAPGNLLFGIDGSGQKHGFLAVGGLGTLLYELPISHVQNATQNEVMATELV